MSLDHQWDGKIIPEENVSLAYHNGTGDTYLVTKIHRYNRSTARIYQYACSVLNLTNNKPGHADVWYDNNPMVLGEGSLLLEDGISFLLLGDGVSHLLLNEGVISYWKLGEYVPVRFRDYDGVVKNM